MNLIRVMWVVSCFWLSGQVYVAWSQDPGGREDAEMERRKILKAADDLELFRSQVEKLQASLAKMQKEVSGLKQENQNLRNELGSLKRGQNKLKEEVVQEVTRVVRDEVGKLMKAQEDASAKVRDGGSKRSEKGYEHVVAKGETLWAIARAYTENGIPVKVDDLRRANGLGKQSVLKVGQKLFIPIK